MPILSQELRERRERVELELIGDRDGSRRHRELSAFARYCIARIERELGDVGHWFVRVAPGIGGFTSTIAVERGSCRTEVVATGFDGPLAIWDAMCRIEQGLREAHAHRLRHHFDVG